MVPLSHQSGEYQDESTEPLPIKARFRHGYIRLQLRFPAGVLVCASTWSPLRKLSDTSRREVVQPLSDLRPLNLSDSLLLMMSVAALRHLSSLSEETGNLNLEEPCDKQQLPPANIVPVRLSSLPAPHPGDSSLACLAAAVENGAVRPLGFGAETDYPVRLHGLGVWSATIWLGFWFVKQANPVMKPGVASRTIKARR